MAGSSGTRQYKVTGHCATFTADTAQGRMNITVYRGHLVPPGATDKQIRHNLSMGLIEPFGADVARQDPTTRAPKPPQDPSPGPAAGPSPDDLSEERKAAQAKLPTDGSAPHANAGEAVWVEYAVTKGYDYSAASAAGKAELVKLLKG